MNRFNFQDRSFARLKGKSRNYIPDTNEMRDLAHSTAELILPKVKKFIKLKYGDDSSEMGDKYDDFMRLVFDEVHKMTKGLKEL